MKIEKKLAEIYVGNEIVIEVKIVKDMNKEGDFEI